MKILAFGASNSQNSINKALVTYATTLISGDVEILDLNDFEMPIFSQDREQANGIPNEAKQFYAKIGAADALLISFAEHNGNFTAAYKNLFDWTSRIDHKVYQGKPAVILATSPGSGGASSVLGIANRSAPYIGLDVKASLSVASFYNKFDLATGRVTDSEVQQALEHTVNALK